MARQYQLNICGGGSMAKSRHDNHAHQSKSESVASDTSIVFTNDWQQHATGSLQRGQSFTLLYDSQRLPQERSTYNGLPTWNILAHVQFAPHRTISQIALQTPGTDEILKAQIDIPEDTTEVVLWFSNSGRSGQEYWDSNFGNNYRFVVRDANVRDVPSAPYDEGTNQGRTKNSKRNRATNASAD
ncbi:MAG: DUF6209 family protein [Polyangiaceae bacterium]